ncbi:DUF2812 domain-containing protein [Ornithinibacillus sp. 179-J 7C1 HS]|uniref:DUF2812 domain-containing protein n=1 Tax=Ornithinibacillus sp. 179-J 7C1 HS TaxID=3142384 RepID=UPI0039A02ACE
MAIKKFRLSLSFNIEKEEQWLTEMSQKGLHFKKQKFVWYEFEEDPTKSYVYQIDFRQNAKKDYFQLYEDAGWEYVSDSIGIFHYFRTDAANTNVRKLYSDNESIQDSYRRMLGFYLLIFFLFLVSQIGIVVTWKGYWIQYLVVGLDVVVSVLYLYMFYMFNKRINFYRKK